MKSFEPVNSHDQANNHWLRGLGREKHIQTIVKKKDELLDTFKVNAGFSRKWLCYCSDYPATL